MGLPSCNEQINRLHLYTSHVRLEGIPQAKHDSSRTEDKLVKEKSQLGKAN